MQIPHLAGANEMWDLAVGWLSSKLESDFAADLQFTIDVCLGTVDRTEGGGTVEIGAAERVQPEDWMVEKVESFRAKLERYPFP